MEASLGGVTVWLEQLKAGDPAAAKSLWDGYAAHQSVVRGDTLAAEPRILGRALLAPKPGILRGAIPGPLEPDTLRRARPVAEPGVLGGAWV